MSYRRLSLFSRLVLSMSIVATFAIIVSIGFLYVRFVSANDRFREDTLLTFARGMARDLPVQQGGFKFVINRLQELHGQYAVLDTTANVLSASAGITGPLVPPDDAEQSYFSLPPDGGAPQLFGLSLRLSGKEPVRYVQVAFPKSHLIFDSILEEFVGDIAWIWIPFVAVILVTNIIVARLALRPLIAAAREAEQIGPASISSRITEGNLPPDVLAIVKAVNNALDRLQGGYLGLERFAGNIAHELRTPMTIIKAQLAAPGGTTSADLRQDFESLERIVTQLVDRVRLGGMHFEAHDRVDLAELARSVGAFLAPVIVDRGKSIEFIAPSMPVWINGANDFIFRALRNLIENAVEHSPPFGTVTVVVGTDRSITVSDHGNGFPKVKLDPAERRSRQSLSDRFDGLGLGLSIVDETMVAHGGRLVLSNPATGGASARMEFPVLAKEPDGGTSDL
jgi:signal transduction histidine kinase